MYYFLVNPTAGGGRAMDTAKTLEAHLKAEGLEYEFGYSQYHKHAIELVRDAVERGHRKIFALGGDGAMDSMIVIRSIAATPTRLIARAGGGIVADSLPAAEYAELRAKIDPVLAK